MNDNVIPIFFAMTSAPCIVTSPRNDDSLQCVFSARLLCTGVASKGTSLAAWGSATAPSPVLGLSSRISVSPRRRRPLAHTPRRNGRAVSPAGTRSTMRCRQQDGHRRGEGWRRGRKIERVGVPADGSLTPLSNAHVRRRSAAYTKTGLALPDPERYWPPAGRERREQQGGGSTSHFSLPKLPAHTSGRSGCQRYWKSIPGRTTRPSRPIADGGPAWTPAVYSM